MRARIDITQCFVMRRLMQDSSPIALWLQRLKKSKSNREWRDVRFSEFDMEDIDDFGIPLWRAIPYALGDTSDALLISRSFGDADKRQMLEGAVRGLLDRHGLKFHSIECARCSIGHGLAFVSLTIWMDDVDPDLIAREFIDDLDDVYDNDIWSWFDSLPFAEFEHAGRISYAGKSRPASRYVTDTYGTSLVFLCEDDAELTSLEPRLEQCARRYISEAPSKHDNIDPDIRMCGGKMGDYFGVTTSYEASVKMALLWSMGILIYDALTEFNVVRKGGLPAIRLQLTKDVTPKSLKTALDELAGAERRFVALQHLGDVRRMRAIPFDEIVFTPLATKGEFSFHIEQAKDEIERLKSLLEHRTSEREQMQQRRLSWALYILAVIGGLTVTGEISHAAVNYLGGRADVAQSVALISQITWVACGALLGLVIFRR